MAKLTKRIGKKKLVVITGIALLILLSVVLINRNNKAEPVTPAITHSTSTPAEVAPKKDTYKWVGASEDPKYITLPTISAEGFIQKAGIDQNNQIAVPDNIHMAAWFNKSSQPGKPGLSIIDGHVNGRVNDGIFKNLTDLKNGDIYTVELGNGAIKKFKVIGSKAVPTADAVNYLFSQEPDVTSQLNLITCTGTFDPKTHSYDQRLIVSSAYIQ